MYNSFKDIKKEYENIRQRNCLLCDEKKNRIYNENPELKEIDKNITKLFVAIVKSDNNDDAIKIEHKIEDLRKKRIAYLKEHNIIDDYREVQYTCNICKDTGFVNGKKCSCFIEKEIELFDNVSNFRQYIEHDNFENLNLNFYKQEGFGGDNTYLKYMEDNIKDMKDGISNIDKSPYNLLLIGTPGTGKTFLSRCLGAMCLKQNKSVLYQNAVEYIDSLKPDYTGVPLKQYAVLCDLFILDDLGTEYTSDFTRTEINYIIDKRLNDGKSTIITTNILPNDLKTKYFSSMCSRLINSYKNIYLSGVDLRRVKNVNNK